MPSGVYQRTKKHLEAMRKSRLGQKAWNKGLTNKVHI